MINRNAGKFVLTKKNKDRIFICGMLLIPILHFLFFYVYVNFDSILLAFRKPTVGGVDIWTLEHFSRMFNEFRLAGAGEMGKYLANTMIYFFTGLCITFPLSFFLCYFLYKKVLGYRVYRVIFFLPSIISASAIAILFKYIIAANGPFGVLYKSMKGTYIPNLLAHETKTVWVLVFYNVFFGLGGNLVLFSGAMSNIDKGIIEASKIDGAGMATEMFRIVIPLMWPTMSTVLTFQFIGIFGASGPLLLLAPNNANAYSISYWIFNSVRYGAYNYPAAVGLFFTIVGAPIVLFMRWLLSRHVDDVTM